MELKNLDPKIKYGLIGAVVLVALLCGTVLFSFLNSRAVSVSNTPSGPDSTEVGTETGEVEEEIAGAQASAALIKEYEKSSYKVVTLVPNPFGKFPGYEVLYVVTNRGINDDSCGGLYSAGSCYFFLESTYHNGPTAKYVTTWGGGPTGIGRESIKFIDVDTVRFTGTFGDAGVGILETWELNVRTGSSTRTSQVRTEAEDFSEF
jgi:hypothetical protein